MTDINRFMSKTKKEGDCWLWVGAKDRKGYGKFSVGDGKKPDGSRRNSMVSAHRFSFTHFNGSIPTGQGFHGTCVLHRCDNPSCVNPAHLFLGSNADNVHDMDSKGRRVNAQLKGSKHKLAILNEDEVLEIYRMCIEKVSTQRNIAAQFNVCFSTVSHIKTGRLWSHLTGAAKREPAHA